MANRRKIPGRKINQRFLMVGMALLAAAAGGCNILGGGDEDCIGAEACVCTPGGACDPGLACVSGRCVKGGAGVVSSYTDSCLKVTESFCGKLGECFPYYMRANYGDLQNCIARESLSCPASPPTGSNDTPQNGLKCAQEIRGTSCEDYAVRKYPASCILSGSFANGLACSWHDQCQGSYCARAAGQQCGTCAPLVSAGGRCLLADDCAAGLECNPSGVCVSPVGPGMACNNNIPCSYGFFCGGGSCVATVRDPGASCSPGACSFPHGLFCNLELKRCQAIGVASPGMACGFIGGGYTSCGGGVECDADSVSKPMDICPATAQDGESCNADKPCRIGADCINGICRIPSALSCG